jgi:hypothetical protein
MANEEHTQEHERPFDPAKDIFVFGSNEEGHHYAGAAKYAQEHCGAQPGVGVGPTGQAYAIVTMSGRSRLKEEVAKFIDYASHHPEQDNGIAPLFLHAPANCLLPLGWRDIAMLRAGLEPLPKVY